MKKPAFMLPTLDKSPVCVRFCPIIFKKDETDDSTEELISLDYKIVFAVGTIDSIYIYDTQSTVPRTIHTNIHYLQINDISWRGDSMLAACSSDGYITFVIFEKNELGIQAQSEELNEKLKAYTQQYASIDINKTIFQLTSI
jgi:chromatin assembly factor 1 subunit B